MRYHRKSKCLKSNPVLTKKFFFSKDFFNWKTISESETIKQPIDFDFDESKVCQLFKSIERESDKIVTLQKMNAIDISQHL